MQREQPDDSSFIWTLQVCGSKTFLFVPIQWEPMSMHCYIFLFVTTEVEMIDAVGLFDFRFLFGLYGGTVVAFAEVTCFSNVLL